MINTLKHKDILNTYKRIDLYRAKYRHEDFTPHSWCFHGNESQNWTGNCSGGFLVFETGTRIAQQIEIDATIYKYVSFKFNKPSETIVAKATAPKGTLTPKIHAYTLTLNYRSLIGIDITDHTISTTIPTSSDPMTVFLDMSNDVNWQGQIIALEFIVTAVSDPSNYFSIKRGDISCEYIKVDKENVFLNIADDETVTELDINKMRNDVDTLAGQAIDWRGEDRVKQFIHTIKKKDIEEVNNRISLLPAYNGCATCDNYQCSCDGTDYGHVPCQACNQCDMYQSCSWCDLVLDDSSKDCTCDGTCYTQAKSCTCDNRCYNYSPCTCDERCNTCYTGNERCYSCYTTIDRYIVNIPDLCSSGYQRYCDLDGYPGKEYHYLCAWCDINSDTGCGSNGPSSRCPSNSVGCKCNEFWYKGPGRHICPVVCDSGYSCTCDTSRYYYSKQETRTTTDIRKVCASCYSGYGASGCSTCDFTCNAQSRSCACNASCFQEAVDCKCDGTKYNYQSCVRCDVCDMYLACSCDQTCFQESCSQCHKTEYSNVPI